MISLLASLALLPAAGHAQAPAARNGRSFDIRAFGATGDGKTIDTPAIQRAIDAAAAAGGGTVYFPAGTYASYSIHLKSHVGLYLDHGSTLLAADTVPGQGYDVPEPGPGNAFQDFGHSHWHNSLIWGENIEDVSIEGPGLIWGKGLIKNQNDRSPVRNGNKSIALKDVKNVILRDFSILHGGHFGILATGADNLTIDNLKIDTNRDGIDVDACRNVRISNTSVNSPWDDAIVLKTSYGLGRLQETQNVTITNSFVSGGFEEGTLLDATYKRIDPAARIPKTGRVKLGTESNGDFKDITISNITFDYSGGLALETVDGSHLEDISISNITMRDVTNAPIFLRLGARMRGPKEMQIGSLKRVNISNVVVHNSPVRWASIISGIPGHEIEDVKLNNIMIFYPGGGTKEQAAIQPPEKENAYPEPTMFGEIPAYGFYVRHVNGIEFNNVQVAYETPDQRPAFILDDVQNADFFHVKADHAPGVPTFVLKDVTDFTTAFTRGVKDTHVAKAAAQKL
jgi:polygalacturonase